MSKGFNTLIVDDEPEMCWVLENMLMREGHKTVSITSGKEALKMCDENSFELAFLDAKLPDVDGIELAKLIKQKNENIKIIIISGYYYQDAETIQKGLAEGCFSGFVGKPFKLDEIRLAVKCALTFHGMSP
ncbi:MAG TPA: response regulator [Candidatus Brocadiia bacterium]|nr:response regulator [Planctomycetota bacterium]MDO8091958.1 response regulator [Candidatus Brocadiales bacterium]